MFDYRLLRTQDIRLSYKTEAVSFIRGLKEFQVLVFIYALVGDLLNFSFTLIHTLLANVEVLDWI